MKKNIIANFLGRFWGVFSNFIFIPLYIQYLGFENYSLISFTLIIAGIMGVVDAGLTSTLSREFARKDRTDDYKLRVFKTLESLYLTIFICCSVVGFFLSDYIIDYWINSEGISREVLLFSIRVAIAEIGLQLLFRFYKGGVLGLERQVKANVYQVLWGVVRNAFVVLPIYFYPQVKVFFVWQLLSSIIFVAIIRRALIKMISNKEGFFFKPKVEKDILKEIWKFASGVLLIAIVASVNTQMDKFAISKFLSLEYLGYYTIAYSLARVIGVLVNPISVAILPRLTSLYSTKKIKEATQLFNKINLITTIIIISIMSVVMLFGKELIWIWTGDMELAGKSSFVVAVLVIGYSSLALQILPYNLALANGYTKLNNIIGIISLIITIPGYILTTQTFGMNGAAYLFSGVQIVISIFYILILSKMYLVIHNSVKYYFRMYLNPIVLIVALTFFLHKIPFTSENRFLFLIWIGFVFCIVFVTSILVLTPAQIRDITRIKYIFKGLKNKK
ncbi:O-antigen/teichoic acid export membrane protein [Tenacibaculum sp. 190524A05c]|uniref:lipopolysaccharide biosynthesis protein n=1 Tax=Tenacibaculum platacis TaxID=3137852 RepID=UPI0031FB8E8F